MGLVAGLLGAASTSARATITPVDRYILVGINTLSGSSGYAYGAIPSQVVGFRRVSNADHGTIWTTANPAGLDLNPAGATSSSVHATDGSQQGGSITLTSGGANRAWLWFGAASGSVDLHPSGFEASSVSGVGGGQQVGSGRDIASGTDHALLWTGTAASVVDLNPAGMLTTYAGATDGTHQVGIGLVAVPPPEPAYHALMWSGTAASAVDLNPVGYNDSYAVAIGGGQVVGDVTYTFGSQSRAFVWTASTAASGVDLQPSGAYASQALDTDGGHQVGSVSFGDPSAGTLHSHAALWSGTAASFIDLQALLPASFTDSRALSIENDVVYGVATDVNGNVHAMAWSLVPEPTSLLGLAGVAALLPRRSRATYRG